MPRNGAGTFTNVSGNPVVTGTTISSTVQNNTTSDYASAFTQSLASDGQTTPTANIPLGGFRITGVGAATARTDAIQAAQVQDGGVTWGGTAGGTADALTVSLTPALTAYAVGQRFVFKSGAGANTGAATLQINGIATPGAIQINGSALTAGQLEASRWYEVLVSSIGPAVFQLDKIANGAGLFLPLAGGTMTGPENFSYQTIANHATTADIWAAQITFFNSAVTVTAIPASPIIGCVRWIQPANGTIYTHDGGNVNVQGGASYTTTTNDWIRVISKSTSLNDLTVYKADGGPVGNASTTKSGGVELLTQAEYDAGTDTTRAPTASLNKITLATEVASTSGTSIDFTGIPAGVRSITVMFDQVSLDAATSNLIVQIGDAGGPETTSYVQGCFTASANGTSITSGFCLANINAAGDTFSGSMRLSLQDASNTWCAQWGIFRSDTSTWAGGGMKQLSATLDRIRLTTVSGTPAFDAGSVNIQYER